MITKKRKKKIIIEIKGGLGNQLFGYSFGFSLAKQLNCDLYFDISMYSSKNVQNRNFELAKLKIPFDNLLDYKYRNKVIYKIAGLNRLKKKISIGLFTKKYKEKKEYVYDNNVFNIDMDTYFDGYWQSYKYFSSYRKELLDILKPSYSIYKETKKIWESMSIENSISIHVRRGDYNGLGWNIPMEYYDKALEVIKKRKIKDNYKENIAIFSDDIDFCKDYFRKYKNKYTVKIIDYESENKNIIDMFLMSKCAVNIIANSSYSWWAAWLNENDNKIVVCPELGVWKGDFYPQDWIKLKL